MSEENVPGTAGDPVADNAGSPAPAQNSGEETHDPSKPAEASAQQAPNLVRNLRKQLAQKSKELEALKAQSPADQDDFKAKYTDLSDRFNRLTSELGRSKIENMLAGMGVIKPALAAKLLSDQIKVEDGQLVTETGETPEEVVRAFVAENPYLLKSRQSNGVGSNAPAIKSDKPVTADDIARMTPEQFAEWEKQAGVGTQRNRAFGR